MRFAPTPDEIAAMRPLVDLIEERIARRRGISLEQYRAEKAEIARRLVASYTPFQPKAPQ